MEGDTLFNQCYWGAHRIKHVLIEPGRNCCFKFGQNACTCAKYQCLSKKYTILIQLQKGFSKITTFFSSAMLPCIKTTTQGQHKTAEQETNITSKNSFCHKNQHTKIVQIIPLLFVLHITPNPQKERESSGDFWSRP